MKRFLLAIGLMAAGLSLSAQVRIAAHRGFWNCEEAGQSENSIAALKAAQDNGLWGSEFDVHLTSDDVIVVNHDNEIGGVPIHTSPYSALSEVRLPNGEKVPTIDEYLEQGAGSSTVLVLEIKNHGDSVRAVQLAAASIEALKKHNLYDPERVIFISFNYPACKYLASAAPGFMVQYLRGDKEPAVLHEDGISGLDYPSGTLYEHPEWVEQAHGLGMSVNVWTVNAADQIKDMIDMGVDCITTNYPLRVRELLGNKEIKAK